jgi:predicted ArsR family transcriptional regulator
VSPRRKPGAPPGRAHSRERRQEIIQTLATHGPMTADDLTLHLPIQRSGIQHHLQVLEDDGAVVSRLETRAEVAYRVRCGAPVNTRRKAVFAVPVAP